MDITFRGYGPGLVEFGYSYREKELKKLENGVERLKVVSSPEEIAQRAARRARTVIRRRIMALGLDHLLTLTYRANVTDFLITVSHLRRFIRLVRKKYPGYRWVAVPEIQEERAQNTGFRVYHWHLAVKGFQDVKYLRQVWRHVIGEGNIDVRGPSGRTRCGKLNLAYYLVKYISKSLDNVNAGMHRYFGTREAGEVQITKISVDRPSSAMLWIRELMFGSSLVVKQSLDTAFGGWGATWGKSRGIQYGKISSCTA